MFEGITEVMLGRMKYLENIDKIDRTDGTEKLKRLRQIPPETGKFIALLAANCPFGDFIEIGTSAGYSSMWIALALKNRIEKLKTFEILPEKVKLAKETFHIAEISGKIELVEGDFIQKAHELNEIAFCFLDCEKHLYEKCFDIISGKLVKGGFLIADNAINHYEHIKGMIQKAESDNHFDCLTVPIGKGEFICRRKYDNPKIAQKSVLNFCARKVCPCYSMQQREPKIYSASLRKLRAIRARRCSTFGHPSKKKKICRVEMR